MRWTERQRAMLEAMGIRLWGPMGSAPEASVIGPAPQAQEGVAASPMAPRVEPLPQRWGPVPQPIEPVARSLPPVSQRFGLASDAQGLARDSAGAVSGASAPEPLAADRSAQAGAGTVPDRDEVLDAAALALRAAACTACALCAGRTRAVFGAPEGEADWLVVGDAPDAADDEAGEPFTGAAGRLLDNMLAAIEVTRGGADRTRRAYVTHAVKCRPPGQRLPEAAELERCSVYLQRQIALVRPRVILVMGRCAAQALLGSAEPVARLRGRVHRHAGTAVVVTAAPAFLLRHPEGKADAWDDLCLALEAAHRPAA